MKINSSHKLTIWWRTAWVIIILLGLALRLQRISWQPIWWDEGYSVYFATEPALTMLRLTALDIHPPFYYLLLHFWFGLNRNTDPETARLLSILIGALTLPAITWASLRLWPRQRAVALFATLLLAVSPMHIYYSQEIRMYGLALLLSLIATIMAWNLQKRLEQGEMPFAAASAYILVSSLALLTLYYTGFILLTHQLWMLARNRRQFSRQLWFIGCGLLILLIQLPWWLYALPKLLTYIGDKVLADQDIALPIWTYLWRHWLAFTAGHLAIPSSLLETLRQTLAASVAILLVSSYGISKWRDAEQVRGWLFTLLLLPAAVAFTVNIAYPFFPEGGERLLLQLLPYLILLLAYGATQLSGIRSRLTVLIVIVPMLAATLGNTIYFTMPRYTEHDYRPIIADITQRSRSNDTVLALFPWQVGYWRAYSPRTATGAWLPPQPAPVDQTVLTWDDAFVSSLDAALAKGTIWFPMPLSFGSTLPPQIEEYLAARARNLENHWYSPATRVTAWVVADDANTADNPLDLLYPDGLRLIQAGSELTAPSANTPIAVDLCWQLAEPRPDLRATLRLVDAANFTWATRDLTPLAEYIARLGDDPCREAIAVNIPAGLPPATYRLLIGIGPESTDQLFTPAFATSTWIPVSEIVVTAPQNVLSPQRLTIDFRLPTPVIDTGLQLLGYSRPGMTDALLAGDQVGLSLYLQNSAATPPSRDLYVSLLDEQGAGVAGWQGWPFPQYRTDMWANGALAQIPVQFDLPADLPAGGYTLLAGLIDPQSGDKTIQAKLGRVTVVRRPTTDTPPVPQIEISPAPTVGTHATLIGYDIVQTPTALQLDLTWKVLQTLLPPHHIFVHLLDVSGQQIAQIDGEPHTIMERAPTGSWLPGEYLVTHHIVTIPADASAPFFLRIGLYLPDTGERLPVTISGATVGDNVEIGVPSE